MASPFDIAVLSVYYLTLGILSVYGAHRLYLVRLRQRTAIDVGQLPRPTAWPSVTVQLPMFNEPEVAVRLIDAVAAIDYPGALDIQVLDDSTDETIELAAACIRAHRARGIRIAHIRRSERTGFKAGALAHGMESSEADLFAVFDADFVPAPDILLHAVPHFADGSVGMVQARWEHLNREASMLTRVQAIYLDSHFAVESAARHRSGRFFNFNGTAGVWRREAIAEAGGWSASTLTEDLDLSYRAQLAGWKFVFLPDVEVPAELPSTLHGFHDQQHRWAKGSIQTARKILPEIVRSKLPLRVKCEAFFHLTNNSAYLLTLVVALLMVPAIGIRQRLAITWTLLFDAILFAISTGSVLIFYLEGQRWAGNGRPTVREMLSVLPVGIGLSIRNSAAVLEGLTERGGIFLRTRKVGDAGATKRAERAPRLPVPETLLALFYLGALLMFVDARQWASVPFLFLFLAGFTHVAWLGISERVRFHWG
jgi:cellulose synthase/poly-beta-1,6-N-acetylglucosamine synthase-like glycosyltransferase